PNGLANAGPQTPCHWLMPMASPMRGVRSDRASPVQARSPTMKKNTARAIAPALACIAPTALALTPAVARAQNAPQYQPAGVLSLNAQASADVPQDVVD